MNIKVTPISVERAAKMLESSGNFRTLPAPDSDDLMDPRVDYSHPGEPSDLIDTEESC